MCAVCSGLNHICVPAGGERGCLTRAANLLKRQTEVSLALAAESIANAGRTLNELSLQTKRNRNELYNLSFGLETEAAAAMEQNLQSREPTGAVRADPTLLHIFRNTTQITADALERPSETPSADLSFNAAFWLASPARRACGLAS